MRRIAVVSRDESIAGRFNEAFETIDVSPEQCPVTDSRSPDAYVVDASDADRLAFVEHLAERTQQPIVVIGSDAPEHLGPAYLEAGADAFLAGDAPNDEWLARLRAVTRRAATPSPYEEHVDYRAGNVAIVRDSRKVLVDGLEVRLTRTEFNLLLALAERMDEIVPHRKLMAEVWGPEYLSARHYLRVYVRRLREKIEADPERPVLLVAQRGAGYMLRSVPAEAPQDDDE
ncbi:MAG: response regulator transcription factor [Dehalococcoidia bacterium]